jgi:hypothetical protein
MAVDMLRSCYSTRMRFFRNRPDVTTLVHWFFCEPDAGILPFPTVFNSGNWWSDKTIDSPLGEVRGDPRPWRNGQPPAPYEGVQPCGTAEEFFRGTADPPVPPIERLANGMPVCCAPEVGGLLYEGSSEVLIQAEQQVRRAILIDIYRVGTGPPAAPAVAAVPALIAEEYGLGCFRPGAAGDVPYTYTHTLLIPVPFVDIRGGYNGGAWGFNADVVYFPTGNVNNFGDVVFVGVVQLAGSAATYQHVYIRMFRPTAWPGTV